MVLEPSRRCAVKPDPIAIGQRLKIMVRVKTELVSLALLGALSCWDCSAQVASIPSSLGEANFDLLEMDFREQVPVLLGQTRHYRTSVQEGPSLIAYNFIVGRKQDRNIRVSLGRLDISSYRYEFKASPAQDLIGVTITFVTERDLRAQILENIDRREKPNRVAVGSLSGHPVVHRWESRDRVIQFAFATAQKDKVYSISIVSNKYQCGDFPLEQVFVGEDICLKKYPRN